MKKSVVKGLSVALCAALAATACTAAVYAAGNKKDSSAVSSQKSETTENVKAENTAKDETVYVIAGADGAVKKIIVSDWIKNSAGLGAIADKTELSDTVNLKGDETYTVNSDNARVWDAAGKDIYYQGNISKELPVKLNVSYKLDGKSISPSELAGKSGKVTIRYDYENTQYETVEIDGAQKKIYVPFAMLTGLMLDNDVFTNVEIKNGRILNDGDRIIAAGIALPGLQSNLEIDKSKYEIPEYVEITADCRNFELSSTVTIATNELFSKVDTAVFDEADALSASLDQLTGGMKQLLDGSNALYGGLCTLLDKSAVLINGIDELAAGAAKLSSGAADLQSGASELSSGLNKLTENNAKLTGGAETVFNTLLATVTSQVNAQLSGYGMSVDDLTIKNYKTELNALIAKLGSDEVHTAMMAALTEEQKQQATLAVLKGYFEKQGLSGEQLSAAVAAGAQNPQLLAALEPTINAVLSAAVTEKLSAAAKQVEAARDQLLDYQEFYDGVNDYTSGAADAAAGAGKLNAGSTQLKAGIDALNAGIFTMKDGAPALKNGITELKNGSKSLKDGLAQFNEEGIKKLTDVVEDDLAGTLTRLKATVEVSKDYKSFAGIADGADGQVKFIYRTDSVKVK